MDPLKLQAVTMIDGEWLTGIVVAIIGAVGAIYARTRGRAEGRAENITLGEPVPTVPVQKIYGPVTWDQHKSLVDRVGRLEATTIELRRDMAVQFRELLEAGGQRENRIAEKLDGIARGIHHRIDRQMEICSTVRCSRKLEPRIP
jgi:hypothetical protein